MVTDSKGTEELISFIILPMTDRQTDSLFSKIQTNLQRSIIKENLMRIATWSKWSINTDEVCARASKCLFALRTLKCTTCRPFSVPHADLRSVYCYFIRPFIGVRLPRLTFIINMHTQQSARRYSASGTSHNLPSNAIQGLHYSIQPTNAL